MKLDSLFAPVLLGSLGLFGLAGCSGAPDGAPAAGSTASAGAPESTASSAEALGKGGGGGGGGLGFNCSPIGCICWGDEDCNNMFGSGACDGRNPTCWERGPAPVYCTCYATTHKAALTTGPANGAAAVDASTVAAH